jgi:hypothetical protein
MGLSAGCVGQRDDASADAPEAGTRAGVTTGLVLLIEKARTLREASRMTRAESRFQKYESRLLREKAWRARHGGLRSGLILTPTMLLELVAEMEAMGLTALAWRYRAVASSFDVTASARLQ